MLDELRRQFLLEFTVDTRSRLRTAMSHLLPVGSGGEQSAQLIAAMMHTIAGEAMLIGCADLAHMARTSGAAANLYLETRNDLNLVACARALRTFSRAIEALIVPAAPPSIPPAAASPTSPEVANTECIRVLVVDDSQLNATLLREGLASDGFDASSVTDDFALIVSQLETLRPHVLLVDWFMPGCDTSTLCSHIQKSPTLSSTRVLLVTSLPAGEAEAHASALGIAGAVSKEQGLQSISMRVRALFETPA